MCIRRYLQRIKFVKNIIGYFRESKQGIDSIPAQEVQKKYKIKYRKGKHSFFSDLEMYCMNGILHLCKNIEQPGTRYLEIGTSYGDGLAQVHCMIPSMELHSVNILPHEVEKTSITKEIIPKEKIGSFARKHGIKYTQYYEDSKKMNFRDLGLFDAIFIDGCHDYEYVLSDSYNAHRALKPGGVIIWHDYKDSWLPIKEALQLLNKKLFYGELAHVTDTWLVYWHKQRGLS